VIPTSSLTTNAISQITNTTAVSGGNINATTDDVVIARGVVWSTTSSPTVDLSTKTLDGSGSGTFTSNISGLTLSTTYYVRAYATNSNRTDYGSQRSFTTSRAPTVSATSAASSITYYTAAMAGNISSDNGLAITARGFVYATAATTSIPSLTNSVTTVSGTTGSYTGTITGLTESTTYYVSSYATNSSGTTYGTPISFTSPIAPLGSGVSVRTAASSFTDFNLLASPAGLYYFAPPGATSTTYQLYYEPNFRGTGYGFVKVFSSPTRAAATVNLIGQNLPITELMVNNAGSTSTWATAGWNTGGYRRFNVLGSNSDYPTTGTKNGSGFRVFFGANGGHGIYNSSQYPCSWSSSTGAIGAGYDGSTCGTFPDGLIWGEGTSGAGYSNIVTNSVWEIWIRW
jgi:hypothetical protein